MNKLEGRKRNTNVKLVECFAIVGLLISFREHTHRNFRDSNYSSIYSNYWDSNFFELNRVFEVEIFFSWSSLYGNLLG